MWIPHVSVMKCHTTSVLYFRTLDRSSPVFAPEIIFCLVTLKTFDLITDLRHLFLQTNQRSYTGHDVASW